MMETVVMVKKMKLKQNRFKSSGNPAASNKAMK